MSSSSIQRQPGLSAGPSLVESNGTGRRSTNIVRNSLAAGSVSGVVATVVLYPLDVIRTKMQAEAILSTTARATAPAGTMSTVVASSAVGGGPIQVLRHVMQHGGGIRALYTGMAVPLAAQGVYKATVFTVNNVTEQFILQFRQRRRPDAQLTYVDRFTCGFVAGAVNGALFVTPVEYIRNQMIAHHSRQTMGNHESKATRMSNLSLREVIQGSRGSVAGRDLARGLAGLWRGLPQTILRDGLGCGAFFAALSWAQVQLQPGSFLSRSLLLSGSASRLQPLPSLAERSSSGRSENIDTSRTRTETRPGVLKTALAGAFAGLAYWVVALPLDAVKTWVQSVDPGSPPIPVHSRIRNIYQESGSREVLRQLFRGWQVAYGRGMPSAAITLTVYSLAYREIEARYP
jgi:Mitochondrial carrier protein